MYIHMEGSVSRINAREEQLFAVDTRTDHNHANCETSLICFVPQSDRIRCEQLVNKKNFP